jgi:hypothetical protein
MSTDLWLGIAIGFVAAIVLARARAAWERRQHERAIERIGSPGDGDV